MSSPRSSNRGGVLTVAACFAAASLLASCQNTDSGEAARDPQVTFNNHCAACHGTDGTATIDLTGERYQPDQMPDSHIRTVIGRGTPQQHGTSGPMPPMPHLTDADIDAAIAHLRALQDQPGR